MTPSPTPAPVLDPIAEAAGLAVVIGGILALLVTFAFGAMLLRASRYPMPVPIIAPLAMLSLVALVIGGVSDVPELIPLAATGFGALAAVLTARLGKPDGQEQKPPQE